MADRKMDADATFRCVIVGQGSLPLQCAELLLSKGNVICGVVSGDPDLIRWAHRNEIPHSDLEPTYQELCRFEPFDFLFSIVNPHVLKSDVLEMPARYAINYHDGPLPRYGGVHATSWAIMNREKTHGVTWHVMTDRVDAGDILAQPIFALDERETAITLNAKCYTAALEAFGAMIEPLQSGAEILRRQDPSERSFYRLYRRPQAACVLSWQETADAI
ncbi:MAG TPA: formyltransferase family protein, partial [Chthonomonadaceae bacterium]|nr:formyltransferase family protein [Chthonomonadaceae bacterium]